MFPRVVFPRVMFPPALFPAPFGGSLEVGTLAVSGSPTTVSVSLVLSTTDGGISPYLNQLQRVYRGSSFAIPINIGPPVAGSAPTFTDSTVAGGTSYDYRVVVTDTASQTGISNVVTVTTSSFGGSLTLNKSSFTYQDAQEHGLDYLGGTPDALALRDVRRAALEAYRELTNARTWLFLQRHGRLVTNAPYLTGTINYTRTGGLYERMVTLSGGTWPSWAGPGAQIRIGVVTSQVAERRSDTVLTLSDEVYFGVDIDAQPLHFTGLSHATPTVITSVAHGLTTGQTVVVENVGTTEQMVPLVRANGTWVVTVLTPDTFSIPVDTTSDTTWDSTTGSWRLLPTTPYTLYCDTYVLPTDFVAQDTAVYEGNFGGLTYSDPTAALWYERFTQSSGTPRFFTILGNPLFQGRLTVLLSPFPDQSRTIDFYYHRRPRPLANPAYVAGTVTAMSGSATVTGNGTAWTPIMAGSVLRFGTTSTAPTSAISTSPAIFETTVLEVLSPTSLRITEPAPQAFDAVMYVISDPIDFELGVMLTAFLRGMEKQLAIARTMENKPDAQGNYSVALREACAADSRSYQGRTMGPGRDRRVPYKYMPATFF